MAVVEIDTDLSVVSKSTSTFTDLAPLEDDDISLSSITPTIRKTKVYVLLVLVLGIAGSVCFTLFGIRSAKDEASDFFERRANDLVHVIANTFQEYETAALSIHNVCRRDRNTSRIDFREFYEYLIADGLEMQAAQCIPNVTHEERPEWEARSRDFYAEYYPEIDYGGFTGFEYDPVTDNPIAFTPHRSEAPFYWPVYYTEPVLPNAAAIGLDLYSYPSQKNEIDLAVTSREAVLGGRLKVVQEEDDNAYSILIYHPGIYLETRPDAYPLDLGVILVRVPSLLTRVAALQEESLACYVYDTTVFNTGGSTDFLGAAEYYVSRDLEGEQDTKIVFPEEIEVEDVGAMEKDFLFETSIPIAHGSWKIVILPVNDVYDAKYGFVLFGGAMILISAIGLAIFMLTNLQKVSDIHHAKSMAETERNIVSSLFPENVIQRLMDDAETKKTALKDRKKKQNAFRCTAGADKSISQMRELTSEALFGSKPIAEFHSNVTILCADLTGFTPWASVREPSQVLTLLEVLFHSFDEIAARRNVFKVETVGDCYVAASGLPQPNPRHHLVMAKFANDILTKFRLVVKELETTLGPGDLDLRIGLHSGAVTSGVLRGDKGRFQLFGNTFNIAQQIESSGVRGKIHVSPDTRELLAKDGKGDWLVLSNKTVFIRGKGDLQTYFLQISSKARSTASTGSSDQSGRVKKWKSPAKMTSDERLVSWNVTELIKLLKPVMARRQAAQKTQRLTKEQSLNVPPPYSKDTIPLDEVKEVVALPKFDEQAFMMQFHAEDIQLDPVVENQLTALVTEISHMYRDNPFHCFEHACHVAMSITKMLSRIANPKQVLMEQQQQQQQQKKGKAFQVASEISDFTFGITSDPLTQFAAFVAALIHDADHPGIPNMALIEENPSLAAKYKKTSVAEQNSIDLFWRSFLRDEYKELRECICGDTDELEHFRELILVMVLSTDVMDKELNQKRKNRWNKVFAKDNKDSTNGSDMSDDDMRNRKATIVIEHLIQASDVSHTMQHWNIFRKWNERLFMELYHAYNEGRLDKDPSLGWYEGEKGFLDFYVLPLAKKLDTCGVFGVSSEEFAFYASENRKEWEIYGQEMVQEYIRKYHETFNKGLYEIEEDMSGTMEDSSSGNSHPAPIPIEGDIMV